MALRQLAATAAQRTGLCWASPTASQTGSIVSTAFRSVFSRGFATGEHANCIRERRPCIARAPLAPAHPSYPMSTWHTNVHITSPSCPLAGMPFIWLTIEGYLDTD